ncbi:hypothetical protein M3Y95_00282900 [Aphelenchoides besseyi]|nr:hypothetical protein M3Y95_00282900 [Aphelenchoides besseyi]
MLVKDANGKFKRFSWLFANEKTSYLVAHKQLTNQEKLTAYGITNPFKVDGITEVNNITDPEYEGMRCFNFENCQTTYTSGIGMLYVTRLLAFDDSVPLIGNRKSIVIFAFTECESPSTIRTTSSTLPKRNSPSHESN